MENPIPEIQIRAFESMYFCTLGACAPDLWSDLDILARMVRAAGQAQSVAEENSSVPGLRKCWKSDEEMDETLTVLLGNICLNHDESQMIQHDFVLSDTPPAGRWKF